MKKIIRLLLVYLIFIQNAPAQNVGIGTTSPLARLDINGDMAVRSADITINTTYNYALNVNTVKQSSYKLKAAAALGNFIIAGITSGVDGRIITFANRTGSSMEIYNEDATAVAANRIQTGIGSTIAVYNNGSVTLQYDAAEQRWLIKSLHNNSLDYFGGGGSSSWALAGNDISNTNTGNVGIGGAATSGYKLYIRGNASVQGTGLSDARTGGGLDIISTNVTGQQLIKIDGQNIQSVGSNNIAVAPTPRNLVINPFGGNVGIGTNAVSSPLSFSNTLGSKISFWNSGVNADFGIGLNTGELQFYTAGQDKISFGWGGSANFNKTMTFYPGSGQLGINCLPQTGYSLAVKGHLRSTEVVVETGWADYVFNEDYQLRKLSEVEDYIKANSHLPNIPSAAEIQRDGLKVGELQTKMMEKIEELTLYIIELKKENEALNNRVKKIETGL